MVGIPCVGGLPHFSSQLCSMTSCWRLEISQGWEYLHQGNQPRLQIRAFPTRGPVVKGLPAHHCFSPTPTPHLGSCSPLLRGSLKHIPDSRALDSSLGSPLHPVSLALLCPLQPPPPMVSRGMSPSTELTMPPVAPSCPQDKPELLSQAPEVLQGWLPPALSASLFAPGFCQTDTAKWNHS